jgi:hypothetical protein
MKKSPASGAIITGLVVFVLTAIAFSFYIEYRKLVVFVGPTLANFAVGFEIVFLIVLCAIALIGALRQ